MTASKTVSNCFWDVGRMAEGRGVIRIIEMFTLKYLRRLLETWEIIDFRVVEQLIQEGVANLAFG